MPVSRPVWPGSVQAGQEIADLYAHPMALTWMVADIWSFPVGRRFSRTKLPVNPQLPRAAYPPVLSEIVEGGHAPPKAQADEKLDSGRRMGNAPLKLDHLRC